MFRDQEQNQLTQSSQPVLGLKLEPIASVADVVVSSSGSLVIRPKGGRRLAVTGFARTTVRADGTIELEALPEEIETEEAMQLLHVPWSTLRRLIDQEVVTAWKRSPGRWAIDLASVMDLKERAKADPEFWNQLAAGKIAESQPALGL